jgi:outer membrane protein
MSRNNNGFRAISMAVLTSLVVIALCAEAGAEGKIGYIDSYRIRQEFKEFGEAQTSFDKDVAAWQQELDSLRQELEAAAEEFQRQRLILSEDAKARKEDELRTTEQQFQQKTSQIFGPGGTAEKANEKLVKPILDKINAVLEKIAVENNYDYIFDSVNGNVAYAKKEFDLTDMVLEELNKLE